MTDQTIKFAMEICDGFGFGVLISIGVILLIGRLFLPGYLAEKGKNLATKEDIEQVTRLIEQTRLPYSLKVEEEKARHQLRLAAIDKRLEAHQEAFTLWRNMTMRIYGGDVQTAVEKCESWWEENCLYLEPDAREAFVRAYTAAKLHPILINNRVPSERIINNWNDVVKFSSVVFGVVQLPAFSESEKEALEIDKPLHKHLSGS